MPVPVVDGVLCYRILYLQALHRRRAQAASHLKQPMLAEIYGTQPVWTPLRLLRAALIALVGGFVAGTHVATSCCEPCLTLSSPPSSPPLSSTIGGCGAQVFMSFTPWSQKELAPLLNTMLTPDRSANDWRHCRVALALPWLVTARGSCSLRPCRDQNVLTNGPNAQGCLALVAA